MRVVGGANAIGGQIRMDLPPDGFVLTAVS
jgi:hypothetical protein